MKSSKSKLKSNSKSNEVPAAAAAAAMRGRDRETNRAFVGLLFFFDRGRLVITKLRYYPLDNFRGWSVPYGDSRGNLVNMKDSSWLKSIQMAFLRNKQSCDALTNDDLTV